MARERGLRVALEPRDDLFELPDLALLLEHARDGRLARATRDDALRVDHLSVERDDRLRRSRLPPQLERPLEVLDDDHVTEEIGRDAIVLAIVADEVEEGPARALALRPNCRIRREER